MTKEMERMKDIEARKAELKAEIADGKADAERLSAIKQEAEELSAEQEELRAKMDLNDMLKPNAIPDQRKAVEKSVAEKFVESGRMSIPMFKEGRSLLTTTGTLVKPTGTALEIGGLPELTGTILDDVSVVDATGTQAWEFPYKATPAKAGKKTEGEAASSTAGTFGKVVIGPEEWTTLDEISKQVAKMTPVAYEQAVKENAVIALREEAEKKVTSEVVKSKIIEKKENVKLDEKYLRNLKLGYKNPKGLTGPAVLYIRQEDLIKLGDIRGTNEKKALYSFTYDAEDENAGTITEGGISVRFSINENLPKGQQLYGNPKSIKMLMWGPYEVTTNEGGDYFKRRMIGILGDQTAGAGLTVYHGMQLVAQATIGPEAP